MPIEIVSREEEEELSDLDDSIPAKWVIASTHRRIARAIGAAPNIICGECSQECTSRERLLCHGRVHHVHSFCRCGFGSKWRESVRKHQADKRNCCDPEGCMYEVDQASFATWRRVLNVPVVPYLGEVVVERPAARNPPPRLLTALLFKHHHPELPLLLTSAMWMLDLCH